MDIADVGRCEKSKTCRRVFLSLSMLACLVVSGCMGSRTSSLAALAVDPINTSAIVPLSAESEILSDEGVIQTLVAELTTSQFTQAHPWSNSLTGSAGVISKVASASKNGKSCRNFQTTRHGFDGVALFDGEICQIENGDWGAVSLKRVKS